METEREREREKTGCLRVSRELCFSVNKAVEDSICLSELQRVSIFALLQGFLESRAKLAEKEIAYRFRLFAN